MILFYYLRFGFEKSKLQTFQKIFDKIRNVQSKMCFHSYYNPQLHFLFILRLYNRIVVLVLSFLFYCNSEFC